MEESAKKPMHTIEPEWEQGGIVFAVYQWSGAGTRKDRVGTYPSYELAHQRYPDAGRGALIWPRRPWARRDSSR